MSQRRSGQSNGTLLIQVANKDQAEKIKHMKRINNVEVTVKEHSTLNFAKWTMHSKRFVDTEDDTLLSELKKYDITEIYKIKRNESNILVNTGTMILTFDRCVLLNYVKIRWKSYDVREYIPLPRLCYRCQ